MSTSPHRTAEGPEIGIPALGPVLLRCPALAGVGEIVVTRTVRDLVVGSDLTFTECGEHELKGVGER
jgi:hypothetical protein